MKKYSFLLVAIGILALSSGCRKDPYNMSDEDAIVYKTNAVKNLDYKTKTTFWISDTVFVLDGGGGDIVKTKQKANNTDQQAINYLSQKMAALGYEPANTTDTSVRPDMALTITKASIISSTYYYWNYWGYDWYYWYWYGPYYSPYYFVSYTNTYLYTITMMDPKNTNPTPENPNIIWNAMMGSGETNIFQIGEITKFIDQAFAQSTYLNKNAR